MYGPKQVELRMKSTRREAGLFGVSRTLGVARYIGLEYSVAIAVARAIVLVNLRVVVMVTTLVSDSTIHSNRRMRRVAVSLIAAVVIPAK